MQNLNIKIAIVDDHPIVIQGLKAMLNKENKFEISETFSDGKTFIEFIKKNPLDIALLDISLPDYNGIELCKETKKMQPACNVLIFSNRSDRSIIMQCIQNGASGYLLKNATMEEVILGIKKATAGEIVFCKEVQQIISKPSLLELEGTARLTKREKEILLLLSQGKTSSEIANQLSLSALTVDTHRRNIMQKFGAKNITEMIKTAMEQNMI